MQYEYVLAMGHDCRSTMLRWILLGVNSIMDTGVMHRLTDRRNLPLQTPSIALATGASCNCQDCCDSGPPTQAVDTHCEFDHITHSLLGSASTASATPTHSEIRL